MIPLAVPPSARAAADAGRDRLLILRLPDGLTVRLDAQQVAEIESAIKRWREERRVKRDLGAEISGYLDAYPESTVTEIARSIRARDHRVRNTLESNPRFQRSSPPPGRSRRVQTWKLAASTSEPVPRRGTSAYTTRSQVT